MQQEDLLVQKIEKVLLKFEPVAKTWVKEGPRTFAHFQDGVALAALSVEVCVLVDYVYGPNHDIAKRIKGVATLRSLTHLRAAEGMLRGTIEAIRGGLLADLRTQILVDVQSDFIEAARNAIAENAKDVAAALLCIVLEDSVKRLAIKHGLQSLANQEFSIVTTELFKENKITKATKGQLLAYKDLRNAALHAQWHEVSVETVNALLYFLPGFIEQHGV